jgi:hypothetical protein
VSDPETSRRILASCKINKKESIRAESSVHCGTDVVSLRRYKSNASGTERPVGSGLAIGARKFGDFSAMVSEAQAELQKGRQP